MLFLYELHVYVSMLFTPFHHISMFMFQRFLHYFTMCMFMFPCFLHLFAIFLCLCFDAFYTISPYYLMCYVSMLSTPFHHISMLCFDAFYTISPYFLYVYVSTFFSYYFTVHINRARYVSILFNAISPYNVVCYVSMLFTPFHHISMFLFRCFLHYFTILFDMCYVSMFLYYFTVHISSCALCFHTTHTISPHTLLHVHIYMFSHMNSNSLKIVSLTL
jgi:hypothetical protein